MTTKTPEDFMRWLEENFSEWKICLSIRDHKRNKYRYHRQKGLEVENEEGYKFKPVPNEIIQKTAERFCNAPENKRFVVSYYGWPEWVCLGVDKKLTKYLAHPLRYWYQGSEPERVDVSQKTEPESKEPLEVSSEKQLEDFIVDNFNRIDWGAKLKFYGRQHPTRKPDEKIDLLAKDEGKKEFVVIELKKDKTPRLVLTQTKDYMAWLRDHPLERDYVVRGIIIAKEIDENLKRMVKYEQDVSLFLYEISINLIKIV